MYFDQNITFRDPWLLGHIATRIEHQGGLSKLMATPYHTAQYAQFSGVGSLPRVVVSARLKTKSVVESTRGMPVNTSRRSIVRKLVFGWIYVLGALMAMAAKPAPKLEAEVAKPLYGSMYFAASRMGWSTKQTFYGLFGAPEKNKDDVVLLLTQIPGNGATLKKTVFSFSLYCPFEVAPSNSFMLHTCYTPRGELFDLRTGKIFRRFSWQGEEVERWDFSPDSQYAAGVGLTQDIFILELSTGNTLRVLEVQTTNYDSLSFTPDNRYLIVFTNSNSPRGNNRSRPRLPPRSLTVWDIATGEIRYQLQLPLVKDMPDGTSYPIRFLPGGGVLLLDGVLHMVRRLNWQTGKNEVVVAGVTSATFIDEGRTLMLVNLDGSISLLDMSSGKERFLVYPKGFSLASFALSNDSALLATGTDKGWIYLWQIPQGKLLTSFKSGEGWVYNMAFHPDNSRLAVATVGGSTVRIWKLSQ